MLDLPTSDSELDRAVARLREGGVVAIPTETVYGLGANALDPVAVARVFEIKRRPSFDPLIVHVASMEAARELAAEWPEIATRLARAFWPGPLTFILKKKALVPDLVTAGLPTFAVRVPDHPLTLELLRRVGLPIAAPSANPFGFVSPTTAQHVRDSLGDAVDLVLDGGPCRTGVESTVVSLLDPSCVTLLRPGGLEIEEIERVVAPLLVRRGDPEVAIDVAAHSPGLLKSHYATRTPLWLDDSLGEMDPRGLGARVGWLGLGRPQRDGYIAIESLGEPHDLRGAAARLFAAMRRLDELALDAIVAELPAETGLGAAIADRLRRAARR